MTPFAIGAVAGLAMLQASITAQRNNYADCLGTANHQAVSQQVAPDQYSAFASQHCAAQAERFMSALIAFDTKNGIKRARAAEDAQLQVEDFLAVSAEKYVAKAPKKPAQPAQPPQPVQAAPPAQPQE